MGVGEEEPGERGIDDGAEEIEGGEEDGKPESHHD